MQVDWSTRADDEISTTLRQVQRALARQQKINAMRKARLFAIAMDRMAYQDYLNCFSSLEKEIETGWTKRLRQIRASLTKRKKGGGGGSSSSNAHHDDSGSQAAGANGIAGAQNGTGAASANGTPQPLLGASNYNGPVRPVLSESLTTAMERRRLLQATFKDMFESTKYAYETPTESVYADLELDKVE